MGGQNQVFGSKKQIFLGSARKCPESIDFVIIFADSGCVANMDVFWYFFVFSIASGKKNADFRCPEGHFRGFRRLLEASRAGFGGLLGFPSGFWGS